MVRATATQPAQLSSRAAPSSVMRNLPGSTTGRPQW
jgi:hypothetical protein